MAELGYNVPTPIQSHSIPIIQAGAWLGVQRSAWQSVGLSMGRRCCTHHLTGTPACMCSHTTN
eukprot:354230-Chlamydomonas_euryale.AAC.1